jgi:hypothetical protein
MPDPGPHIRHHVTMPDGKHVEVVYRDHRHPSAQTPAGEQAGANAHIPGAEPEEQVDHAHLAGRADAEGPAGDTEGDATQPGLAPEELHVCFNCSGELVYPLDWTEEGPRHWRIVLRCPECEALREGVFEQAIVERLDDELDHGSAALLSDLKRLTHANMTDEVEFFVRALQADLIVPNDF